MASYGAHQAGPVVLSEHERRMQEFKRKKAFCCPFYLQGGCKNVYRECEYSHDGTKPLPPGFTDKRVAPATLVRQSQHVLSEQLFAQAAQCDREGDTETAKTLRAAAAERRGYEDKVKGV